jgi:hypothetical protein
MRDVALVIVPHELLLFSRSCLVQINDHELHSALILLVQVDGAASLPLGIESTLAEHKNVIGLAPDRPVFDMIAGDERAVLAVTRIIKPWIQPQVLRGSEIRRHS